MEQRSLMDKIRQRQFSKYEYGDPYGLLRKLRELEGSPELQVMPENVRRLRTNGLKAEREMRDAALFCVGMSERLGLPIRFAPVEESDFDFVAACYADEIWHFLPVQLKECVPEDRNANGSVDSILAATLRKYSDLSEITVALRFNRETRFEPEKLVLPDGIELGGLWVFGCVSADKSKWAIWGDFAARESAPVGIVFDYPAN